MSFYFLQINRTAAVPPRLFFFFFLPVFLVQFFLTCVEKYHLQKDDQSHRNVASREPLCGRRANPINFGEIKKTQSEGKALPRFFFLFFPTFFFFRLHRYKDTLTVIYQRASRSDVLPDILFYFFSIQLSRTDLCKKRQKKKNIQRKCVVCEFVNSCTVLGAPAWKMVAVLTGAKKALCRTFVDAHPCWSSVGLERRLGRTPAVMATQSGNHNQIHFLFLAAGK